MHVASIRLGSLFVASFACVVIDEAAGASLCDLVRRVAVEQPSDIVLDFRPTTVVTSAGSRWLRVIRATLPEATQLVISGLGEVEAQRLRGSLARTGIHVATPDEVPGVRPN